MGFKIDILVAIASKFSASETVSRIIKNYPTDKIGTVWLVIDTKEGCYDWD